jgi:hypothetical protein
MRYSFRRARTPKLQPGPERFADRPWEGPRSGVIGVSVPLDAVLVQSDSVLATLQRFVAYPEGAVFEFALRLRRPLTLPSGTIEALSGGRAVRTSWPPRRTRNSPALRFEVLYADGRRATSGGFGWLSDEAEQAERRGPVLRVLRGSGSPTAVNLDYWLWPLPPNGPLQFTLWWSGLGVEDGSATVEGAVLGEAASQSLIAWNQTDGDPRSRAGGVGWTSS